MRKKFCLLTGIFLAISAIALGAMAAEENGLPGVDGTAAVAAEAEADACEEQLAPLLGALDSLRTRLLWATDYETFVKRYRQALRLHEQLPVEEMGIACVAGPGLQAEETVNEYAYAVLAWSECIEQRACDLEAYMPVVERKWWVAGLVLSRAHAALRELSAPASG
ncbi:MAG TPA: hypothetical protein VFU11_10170 [Solirubrobacterales bacterium]|nr:hypothetical protein [Solirubrobacterales bacterium]